MSSLPILRRRRERRLLERQNAQGRLTRGFVGFGLLLAALLGGLILGAAFGYASLTSDLPSTLMLPRLLEPPNGVLLQPSRVYDRTGEHLLAVLAPEDAPRAYIPLDELPQTLIRATVLLADPGFADHPGYSLAGLARPDEHPTLAQALVANLLLWDEKPDLRRALRERILAAQITDDFGREKILEWTLNTANYGHFAYGADAAARLYFGKPASQLTLAESALLAAVGQAPAINPLDAPQAAIQRQQETLDKLLAAGLVSADEVRLARFSPLNFQPLAPSAEPATAFTALALAQLDGKVDRARIERGGMTVITTLDYELQLRAACAVQTQLARLAGQNGENCPGAESLPALPPGLNAPEASASAVVLDPRTGQILAAVGETRQGLESAILTVHRPGTLLTPFVYLAGFTRGLGPASLVWDIPSSESSLQNPDGKFHGPIRLRTAFANDYLVPAGQVFAQMGAPLVQQTMRPFGFDLTAATLGDLLASEARFSLLDVAAAYGVFAAQGARVTQTPAAVLRVEGVDGRLYLAADAPKRAQVVSPQLAYLVTDILRVETSVPAAEKTGQTLDGLESWAVGYSPNRVAVVWMGGAALARPTSGILSALLQAASRDASPDDWPQPAGVARLRVCDPSGLLPTAACPNLVNEVFLEGYQPVQADTLYQTVAVNRETGLLATIFTPAQRVEQRVYMRVPPEAQEWAKTANLAVPPTQYDTFLPPPADANAQISLPAAFAEVTGKVAIQGAAAGKDFVYYRLQYGQGLNPQNWVLIGADSKSPVSAGALAEWDTSGLNGLYCLQLLVVHADNSITTATVPVMVRNP